MGQGDFGLDNLAYSGSRSESTDFNRISQIISGNNKKLAQHVKEIQRLGSTIGTDLDCSDIREQLYETLKNVGAIFFNANFYEFYEFS